MIEVKHFRNSFIEVSYCGKRLWCDPWLSDANNGDWLRAELSFKDFCDRFGYPDIVYISHIHDDHLDLSFLRYLGKNKVFSVVVGDQYESLKIIQRRMLKQGVTNANRIVKLDFFNSKELDEFSLTLLPDGHQSSETCREAYPIDTSLLIDVGGVQIYNQTDNIVSLDTLAQYRQRLRDKCNKEFMPMLSFIPYCGASAYPQSFVGIDRRQERDRLIQKLFKERFVEIAASIGSGMYFPAGGTYSLRYKELDRFKAVPSQDELSRLLKGCEKPLNGNTINPCISSFAGEGYQFFSYDIGDSGIVSQEIEKRCSLDIRMAKQVLAEAASHYQEFIDEIDACMEIWIDSDMLDKQERDKNILTHSSIDSQLLLKVNQCCPNKHRVYISRKLLTEILSGTPWNEAYFGAIYEREPNIHLPAVDIFLTRLFAWTGTRYRYLKNHH